MKKKAEGAGDVRSANSRGRPTMQRSKLGGRKGSWELAKVRKVKQSFFYGAIVAKIYVGKERLNRRRDRLVRSGNVR